MIEHVTESGITYEVETDDGGSKSWWLNGERHRVDGPAVELANGFKYWCLNGERHRVDGPAIEYADGSKSWWLNGERLTEEEFNEFRKQVEELKQHPEDAPLYLHDKRLGSIAKEILEVGVLV